MATHSSSRSGLLDAGGVLSILGGLLELIVGSIVLSIATPIMIGSPLPTVPHFSWMPDLEIWLVFFTTRVIIVAILILVMGAVGIAGGISALRRKSYSLSLAGATCILPTVLFGILAVIFTALSKREFGVETKENGITSRSGLLTAGGILSLIGGGVEVIGAGVLVANSYFWHEHSLPYVVVIAVVLLYLGFMAILGGILALRRKGYKGSLAGAVCALPTVIFGILAIWFISGRECEFEVGY
jgi:hypothetical protein